MARWLQREASDLKFDFSDTKVTDVDSSTTAKAAEEAQRAEALRVVPTSRDEGQVVYELQAEASTAPTEGLEEEPATRR